MENIKRNAQEMSEWDKQVCERLDELWERAHASSAVFYEPEQTRALMQERVDAARARQKTLRYADFAAL